MTELDHVQGGPASHYDAEYYASHLGAPYTWNNPVWGEHFGRVADAIVEHVGPRTVLDAGCALGFLVAALRERRVEAYGIDISEFAIGEVPNEWRPYCRVASITEPLGRDYDLITCIEVLEHLPPEDAERAVANLCVHADCVLYSSTPSDDAEPTHLNVQPPAYWAKLFARHGFFRDPSFDAGVVAPHACLYERRPADSVELAADYEELYVRSRLHQAELEKNAREADARASDLELEREGLQRRAGWQIYTALFDLRARAAPPGTLRDRALRRTLRGVARAIGASAPGRASSASRALQQKAVVFVSGCPGDAKRYRADHKAEQAGLVGVSADAFLTDEVQFWSLLDRYRCIVLHRVAWDRSVERLIADARTRGVRVLFDTDDLVFDPDVLEHVALLSRMNDEDRRLFVSGVHRYRRTIAAVDAAIVSTDALAEHARRFNRSVAIAYNVVSDEMVRLAHAAATGAIPRTSGPLTIAYLSGTPTHERDFAEAADAILWALEAYPQLRFLAVGRIELDERFDRFSGQVERVPLLRWQELPELLAAVDVNLAPLEPDNPFTDSKSCLKYLEAGLVGVPTVASPRRDFRRVIRDGDNGLLADSPLEWRSALERLVESPETRRAVGARAHADVHDRHTTTASARTLEGALASLGRSAPRDAPMTINWVLRAPIPRPDAYPTIFRLASFLAARGHPSRVYVEPVAHLEGLPEEGITRYLETHVGPLPFGIRAGLDAIEPADVTVATNWSTAAAVAAHATSLFKAYLVQGYEPDLYPAGDPLQRLARESYELPLRHICCGAELAARLHGRTGRPADAWEQTNESFEQLLLDWAFARLDPRLTRAVRREGA